MKKAKIMLSAIAVVAVVSGALAFKAKSFNTTFYKVNAQGNCVTSFVGTLDASAAVINYDVTSHSGACAQNDRISTPE